MTEVTPLILGSNLSGGPLPAPDPWIAGPGFMSYTGGLIVGVPAGGNKGNGTINLQDIYINGSPFDFSTVVPTAGGTMIGPLILAADPTVNLGAATKQYVDAAKASAGAGTFLPLTGGTLTGPMILNGDPTTNLGTATKQYVDSHVGSAGVGTFLPLSGGTLTGNLVLNAAPSLTLGAATKGYVDGRTPITTDAPNDANYYTRHGNAWTVQPLPYLPLNGGTLTGSLTLAADPTVNLGAATKQYVDTRVASITSVIYISDTAPVVPSGGLWWRSTDGQMFIYYNDGTSSQFVSAFPMPDTSGLINRAGDTMSGNLILNANPTNALGAVPKQYADAISAAAISLNGQNAWTGQQSYPVVALTDGATINWNVANAQKAKVTLGGNRTINPAINAIEGATYFLWVIQDATGSRTLTFSSSGAGSFDLGTAAYPGLTTTAGYADLLIFEAFSIGGTLKLRLTDITKGFH